jgi:hypothetical protein
MALAVSVVLASPVQADLVTLQLDSLAKVSGQVLTSSFPSAATYTYDTDTQVLTGSGQEVWVNGTGVWNWTPTVPGTPFDASMLPDMHAAKGGLFIHFIEDFSIDLGGSGLATASSFDCDGDMQFGRAVGVDMCTGVALGDDLVASGGPSAALGGWGPDESDDFWFALGEGVAMDPALTERTIVQYASDYSFVASRGDVFSWDPVDGLEIQLFADQADFVLEFTPVPVPAAAYLLASALGLLGWMRRKAS